MIYGQALEGWSGVFDWPVLALRVCAEWGEANVDCIKAQYEMNMICESCKAALIEPKSKNKAL